eukprot:COSAG01_NODE_57741_length_310_cov_0.976303_1_plen_27_part_01
MYSTIYSTYVQYLLDLDLQYPQVHVVL